MGVLLLKEFIEEYDQNHLRTFMIPRNFSDKYWNTKLTYDEWQSLFDIWYEKNALISIGEFGVRKNKILSHGFNSQYSHEKLSLQEWCELWDTYMESLNSIYDF